MPRLGLATIDISTLGGSGGAVTGIDDFFFESFSAGQMHPILTTSRTNLLIYSQDFDNAAWSHNADITVTNSSELAPNGNLEANLIEFDGSGYSFIRRVISATSTAATLSVFAKKGNWRYLGLRNFQTQGEDHTVFDFDTETFSNTASGQTASFEILSNGWYRIIVTQPSPDAAAFVGFAISNASGSELNTTGGQVANVHLFGAQLEQDGFVSNYIPTTGSTVTVSTTLNDTSNVWDFDGTDIMIAEDPEDEGFWEESYPGSASLPELVLNGDYEELGSELANFSDSNISFGNSSDSTTISLSANSYRSEAFGNTGDDRPRVTINGSGIVTGKTYEVTYTPTSFTGSTVFDFFQNNTRIINNHDASIAKTFYFIASDSLDAFVFDGSDTFRSDYTLSIKRVDPNDRWTLGDGCSIEDGKAVCDGSQSGNADLIHSNLVTEKSVQYEITYTVSNYSAGTIKTRLSSGNTTAEQSSNGTFTEIITAAGTGGFRLRGNSTFVGSIDNVSVKEYAIQPLDI
jgi:hypothetical protein